jgi:DNA helicase-2/ATP-dependent DNA helicase PcrA
VVAELARRAAAEHPPRVEGVTVASLHAAKGLEWDVVFLPGLTEGNLPIVHAGTDEAVAEERRLLYVGVTRARQQVLLSWPLARLPGGRRNRTPSRFLDGLRPGRRAARAAGAKPAASHFQFADADPALVEALRKWRREVARDAGVPAYVVFGDETLRHIAAQRPASREGLARIPGLGPGRLDRYGAAVLALCATMPAQASADDKKAGSRA